VPILSLESFIQEVARGAGAIVRDRYPTAKATRSKSGRGDVVTEVDIESERYIIDRIRSEYPEHHILSEESGVSAGVGDTPTWIIDPIDGTRNYAIGIPFFCVSIGLAKSGQPQMGVVYDPIHDEMFFASRGNGAYLNGERIFVSDDDCIDDALVSVSWIRGKVDTGRYVGFMSQVSEETSYYRRFGSAALVLAYVACGKLQGYLQGTLNPWDVAAGILLVEEAGGHVTDYLGNPIDLSAKDIEIMCGNDGIHAFFRQMVSNS